MDITIKTMLSFSLMLVSLLRFLEPSIARSYSQQNASDESSSLLKAAAKDLVTDKLPGQLAAVGFKHYAGYVTVNMTNGRSLFYWFFESSTSPQQKPLLLWLNGGPGCSSVGYGASQEIGPFLIDGNGSRLAINPYSWNIEANILFLESPIGVGFSYTNTSTDYVKLGDKLATNDAYTFLNNWFQKFPTYRNQSFYIAGESYAGKYIPELADLIIGKNKDPSNTLPIQLKGIMMGNPETNDEEDWRGIVDYAWSHAIISDETYKTVKDNCDFSSSDLWSNKNCGDALDEMYKQYHEIDIYSIYTAKCLNSVNSSSQITFTTSSSSPKKVPKRRHGSGFDPCLDDYTTSYYNRGDVQKALHASDGLHVKKWSICNDSIFNQWDWEQSPESVLPIYRTLMAAGIKIWVYSGDVDGRVPVLSTRYSIGVLGLPITKPWRPWYYGKQVSGWVQEYEGLTFVTFRAAGHDVPTFKPAESLTLFSSFISGRPLPLQRY
ncbi:unnamed protein product [Cuscuta epithymum]|uniref:Carboxypeptidase n=2 Tax=Cuscuta epithymum TaxID=186058 RepID=A0AAV0FDY1_9ASTE|nr:unnamed protein product [Cuscuta epithymum]